MELSPRIRWVTKNISGNRILDIGFIGDDDPLTHRKIREALAHAFTVGLDINKGAVLKYGFANSVVGDGRCLPFAEGSFDTITLLEVVEHFEDDAFVIIEEARRVLRVNGLLYLTTPNPYAWARWLRHWLLRRDVSQRSNYRNFLGAADHKLFWEPLSLINVLANRGLKVVGITTKNHRIPFLARFSKRLKVVDLPFYPLCRLGGYTCIIAVAV